MDRGYAIDSINTTGFYGDLLSRYELQHTLERFAITIRNDNGYYKEPEQLLTELQRISRLHWHPSDSRQIGDAMQTLTYILSVNRCIEDLTQAESEELDLFLESFKIRNSVGV